jgi:hypothetical protein
MAHRALQEITMAYKELSLGINVSGFGSLAVPDSPRPRTHEHSRAACAPCGPTQPCTPRRRASTNHSHRTRRGLQLGLHLGQPELDLSGLHGDVRERNGEVVDGLGAAVLTLRHRAKLSAQDPDLLVRRLPGQRDQGGHGCHRDH